MTTIVSEENEFEQIIQSNKKKKKKRKLGVTAIFRDEARFLREWIEYHQMLGVEIFYLYNNLSEDNYQEVLAPYINQGIVQLYEWPYESTGNSDYDQIQCNAYRDALKRAKKTVTWLAIIDVDEFILPAQNHSLITLLSEHENDQIGGLCFVWVFYGTSHIEIIPDDKLMIETLLLNGGIAGGGDRSFIWNSGQYKSIVRPNKVSHLPSPHYCLYKKGYSHAMVNYERYRINHYWTRDEYHFNQIKIPRREKWGYSPETTKRWAQGMNNSNSYSETILKFVPPLRKRMNLQN